MNRLAGVSAALHETFEEFEGLCAPVNTAEERTERSELRKGLIRDLEERVRTGRIVADVLAERSFLVRAMATAAVRLGRLTIPFTGKLRHALLASDLRLARILRHLLVEHGRVGSAPPDWRAGVEEERNRLLLPGLGPNSVVQPLHYAIRAQYRRSRATPDAWPQLARDRAFLEQLRDSLTSANVGKQTRDLVSEILEHLPDPVAQPGLPRRPVRRWPRRALLGGLVGALALVATMLMSPTRPSVPPEGARLNNTWHRLTDADTVFVFVHGIVSNARECWTAADGTSWPEMLAKDERFGNPSIFLGGYYTSPESGNFDVRQAARELSGHLRVKDKEGRPPPLSKSKVIFVAHSTGGLVVRYMLTREDLQDDLQQKDIGLVLLASPSRGSAWADRLAFLRRALGNRMAAQLDPNNDLVRDLDGRFAEMVRNPPSRLLIGVDLFENQFILRGWWFNDVQVVRADASASYFGEGRILGGTDHFSIAKPTPAQPASHDALWEFYEKRFKPAVASASR